MLVSVNYMNEFTPRQNEIIAASIGIIAAKGIQELTIKNLAERVGISEPALYRHFENKTAILQGILMFFRRRSAELFEAVIREVPPGRKQIAAVLEEHCRLLSENPAFSAVVFSEMIFPSEKELAPAVEELMSTARNSIGRILHAGIAAGEIRADISVEHMLTIVMGALRLLVTRWHMSGYGFDLPAEGRALALSLNTLLGSRKE